MSVLVKIQSNLHSKFCDKHYIVLTALLKNSFCESKSSKLIENMDSFSVQDHNIEELRNKSRLSPHVRNILFDEKPYSEPLHKHHVTVKYNRKMYGIYGSKSGVNPGIMWPTKDDIEERKEYEKVAYPFTIQEMVSAAENEKERKELDNQRTHEQVVAKFAKLETWKKELTAKIAKKEAEALAAQEKKDKLVEEVRRHFGYKVDPRDDKFKEMLAQKQKEQRKAERRERLEEREKKAISKLMEKHEPKEST